MPQSSASRASCPMASLRRNTWRKHYRSLSTFWTHRVTHPSSFSGPGPRVSTFPNRIVRQRLDHLNLLQNKANQLQELSPGFGSIWSAWPGVTLLARMISGFRVVGNIESPSIFHNLPNQDVWKALSNPSTKPSVKRALRVQKPLPSWAN